MKQLMLFLQSSSLRPVLNLHSPISALSLRWITTEMKARLDKVVYRKSRGGGGGLVLTTCQFYFYFRRISSQMM